MENLQSILEKNTEYINFRRTEKQKIKQYVETYRQQYGIRKVES